MSYIQDAIEEVDQKVDLGDDLGNTIQEKVDTLESLKSDLEVATEALRNTLSKLRDIEYQMDEIDRVVNEASDLDIEV